MQGINTQRSLQQELKASAGASNSRALEGADISIGSGFTAQSFRAREVGELMDPLVMVDHYVMTAPTFGAHPHAGLSAVSLLFEDSAGLFHNRDSLGNDFDLQPGDLYWLKAGSGAVHDESPREGSRTHGLQVFVNVPQAQRFDTPESLLVRAKDMPVIATANYRVRVALGSSNGITGPASPSNPMTILDGTINAAASFTHEASFHSGVWIQSIQGKLEVIVGQRSEIIETDQAVAIRPGTDTRIRLVNRFETPAHFVLFDGQQIGEPYIQEGPFVMGTAEEIVEIKAAYSAGKLGSIEDNL